jgi:hypothetical protein
MRPLELNRTSWHYRLATIYGPMSGHYPREDICSYVRAVLRGVCFVVFLSAIGGVLIGMIYGNLLAWAIASWQYHMLIHMDPPAVAGVAVTSALALAGIFATIASWVTRKLRSRDRHVSKKPTFIGEAYRSFKEKSCVPIQFPELKDSDYR